MASAIEEGEPNRKTPALHVDSHAQQESALESAGFSNAVESNDQSQLSEYVWLDPENSLDSNTPKDSFISHFELESKRDVVIPLARTVTFGGCFVMSRKCYSTVKQQLEEKARYTAWTLSVIDTIFVGNYTIGNIVSGRLGDSFTPTTILVIGLFGSGACLMLVVVSLWFDFVGFSVTLGNGFIFAVYSLFGFFQSAGGQVETAGMGNWFSDPQSVRNCGTINGFLTCHQCFGDVTAAICTALVLGAGWPYWWALLIPALVDIAWGFITVRLNPARYEEGINTQERRIRQRKLEERRYQIAAEETMEDDRPQPITYIAALQIPMVVQYAIAFGFFQLINNVLFFWLPYFLGKNFDPVTANIIASLYSAGMIPTGIIAGYVSDLFRGRQATVIGVFETCLIAFLAILARFSEVLDASALLLIFAAMGILVGCPNNIISFAVVSDLTSHPSVRGNKKSLNTVTGLINGCASFVACVGLMAVGPLQDAKGWGSVWVFLIGCSATGTLLMSPKIYAEVFPPMELKRTNTSTNV